MSDTHAQTVRYVRDSMIQPSEPPNAQTGAIKWMRENLFSDWVNGLMTVIAIYIIYSVLAAIAPWFYHSVWNAGSLNECREVIAINSPNAMHGGGCFAVISDRWLQLLFGFYRADLHWRPILAFVLLFVALGPILFPNRFPRPLMWLAAAYPFLVVWLLWGGSFWVPILAALGFVIGGIVGYFGNKVGGLGVAVAAAVVSAVVWWVYLMPVVNDGLHATVAEARLETIAEQTEADLIAIPEAQEAIDTRMAELNARVAELDAQLEEIVAMEETEAVQAEFNAIMDELETVRSELRILSRDAYYYSQKSTDAKTIASNLEMLPEWKAAAAEGDETAQRNLSDAYGRLGLVGLEPVTSREFGGFMLAIIIGVAGIGLSLPLGVLLALGRQSDLLVVKVACIVFIEVIRGVPLIVWLFTASLLLNYFLPPGTNFDLVLRVVIMVTLFSAAYIAEVVRGGLAALPKGQYEAADALGLDYWKSMRLIVLPQALKISIPGIVNTFIGLFKDTTLVGIIGLLDPINLSNSIRASSDWNGVYWELFIFIGLVFFVCCFSMGRYSLWLEKQLQRGHR